MTPPVIVLGDVAVKNLQPGFSRRIVRQGAMVVCAFLILLTIVSVVVAIIGVL